MSLEARELELVSKVEMRIALAKDDKLESMLKTYLPPLLLKLASQSPVVRNKVRFLWSSHDPGIVADFELCQVISTCQHIKIRLTGNQ